MVIDRIIRITVQTGLITMIVATLDLVFFLTDVSRHTNLVFSTETDPADPSLLFI